jgi:drug/metabolite transporter (DMT)-like permease
VSRRAWWQFLTLCAVWGASYLFIKIGLRDMSATEIVCARTALAALVLWPVALHRGGMRGLRRRVPEIALLGTIQMAVPFTLITLGERHIASSLAGILVAAAPIWIALLAPLLDPEESSYGWKLGGIGIGIVGVALLLGVDVGGDSKAVLGGVMVVLAALGYALAGLFIKRRFRDADPVGLVAGTTLTAALLTLPAAIATAPSGAPGAGPVAAVVALGVAGTGMAFVLVNLLVAEVGPAKMSLVAYVSPPFALFYGVVFLGEGVTVSTFAGLALILAGSWLAAGGRLGSVARRQLAARRVDVAAACEPDCGPQSLLLERRPESVDRAAG